MTDRFKFVSLLLLTLVITSLGDIYIKPVAPSSITGYVYLGILLCVLLLIAVGSAVDIRRKLKSIEPERRKDYLRRNVILLALLAAYIVTFVGWQIFFR